MQLQKRAKKWIAAVVAAVVGIGAVVALVCGLPLIRMAANASRYAFAPVAESTGGDRIHFLNTQSADAILLESAGHFALIDAAEDSDNPRNLPGLVYDGYEEKVLSYLKKAASDAEGNVSLDFIVGTHAHSDHLGGFDTLLNDPAVQVKTAYLKAYQPRWITEYERESWDNQEVYDQMINACYAHGVQVIQKISDERFTFGNFTITFFNTEDYVGPKQRGENENSLGILVEKDGKRVFLAGDINNADGTEDALGPQIGHVDVLKVGHHGYAGSTSAGFAQALSPDIAILTNTIHGIDAQVRKNLNRMDTAIYGTKEHDGIVLAFEEDGLKLYDQIH